MSRCEIPSIAIWCFLRKRPARSDRLIRRAIAQARRVTRCSAAIFALVLGYVPLAGARAGAAIVADGEGGCGTGGGVARALPNEAAASTTAQSTSRVR